MRSSALRLLLLIGVRAAFNMGGEVQGEGGSRHRRTPARSGVQRGGPSRDETPSGPTHLSNQTTGLKPHLGNRQLISDSNATFHTASPNSSSAANPKDPLTPSPAPPNLLKISPPSHPAPGPKLSHESSRGIPGASPELYVESLESIPSVNPELSAKSLDSIQSVDSKLFTESLDSIPSVDPELFNKRHYRSPRVLFSAHPPDDAEGGRVRVRRRANQPRHRGVYSVCDSISKWVGNKTTAIDIKGNEVTVLPNVRINNIVKKQYFFETTCHGGAHRSSRSGGSTCLGIDSRHWNSYCTNTHTFVLAMTSFESLVAWRLVRINAACVCVLSRKSWRH